MHKWCDIIETWHSVTFYRSRPRNLFDRQRKQWRTSSMTCCFFSAVNQTSKLTSPVWQKASRCEEKDTPTILSVDSVNQSPSHSGSFPPLPHGKGNKSWYSRFLLFKGTIHRVWQWRHRNMDTMYQTDQYFLVETRLKVELVQERSKVALKRRTYGCNNASV